MGGSTEVTGMRLELRGCCVDLTARTVSPTAPGVVGGPLSAREAELLGYLASRPHQTVSRDQLLTDVWGIAPNVISRACDNTVSRVRRKLERDPAHPEHLLTVHGEGYRFVPVPRVELVAAPPAARRPTVRLGHRELDLDRLVVRTEGEDVSLTAQEHALLEQLVDAGGAVVDSDVLRRRAMGGAGTAALHTAMTRLRTKLEADPTNPEWLVTVRGRGYRLEVPPRRSVDDASSRMVGRESELTALAALLAHHRLVLVVGPGGIGKTRVARRIASTSTSPLWVDVHAALDAAAVRRITAGALDLRVDEARATAQVGRALASEGIHLLVLDNLDAPIDIATVVQGWLTTAPKLRIVVTTRRRPELDSVDHAVIPLTTLPDDAARALLRHRARAAGAPDVPTEELTSVVQALQGLPLAIELAAPLLALTSPGDLAVRLRRPLDVLRHGRPDDRHGSVRAAFAGALDELPSRLLDAFLVLARFRGRFDLPVVESTLGSDALWIVRELRDRSLLDVEEGSLRVLEPLRQLAEETRPTLDDGGHALDRAWVEGLVRRYASPTHLRTLQHRGRADAYDAQVKRVDDLVAGALVATRRGWTDLATRCGTAALPVLRHLGWTSPLEMLAETLVDPGDEDPAASAEVRRLQGAACWERGDDRGAIEAFGLALTAAEAADRPAMRGLLFEDLAGCHQNLGDAERALAMRSAAAEQFERLGQPGPAAYNRARSAQYLGAPTSEVRSHFEAALEAARRDGDLSVLGVSALLLARVERNLGLPELAQGRLDVAIDAATALRRPELESVARSNRMLLHVLLGRHDAVDDALEATLRVSRRLPDARSEADVQTYALRSQILRGDTSAARSVLEVARELVASLPRDVAHRSAYLDLREAELLLDLGDPRSALDRATRGVKFFETYAEDANLAEACAVLARCALANGTMAEAEARASQSVGLYDDVAPALGAVGLATRAAVRRSRGDTTGAHADLEAASQAAQRSGYGTAPRSYFAYWLAAASP